MKIMRFNSNVKSKIKKKKNKSQRNIIKHTLGN